MRRFLLFFCFLQTILIFSCQTTKKKVDLISPDQLQTAMSTNESLQIIDVRTPEEYNEGHIANAVNIDFYSDDFVINIGKLKKDEPVYVYCRSGKRSANSTAEFEKSGFTKIYDLEGGILNWSKEGFETLSK